MAAVASSAAAVDTANHFRSILGAMFLSFLSGCTAQWGFRSNATSAIDSKPSGASHMCARIIKTDAKHNAPTPAANVSDGPAAIWNDLSFFIILGIAPERPTKPSAKPAARPIKSCLRMSMGPVSPHHPLREKGTPSPLRS